MDPIMFAVEPGHVMFFARAVADGNPIYRDPDYAADTELGHVIAPPTFTEALQQYIPDYEFRPAIGKPWMGSGATPSGVEAPPDGGTVFHAEQHFAYERAVRAGEILFATTTKGDEWEKDGRRGGRLVFREMITEFRDEAGQLVVTSRQVSVETQRAVEAAR
jgi:hypothetical protein